MGDDEIKKHLESCGENASYLSHICWKHYEFNFNFWGEQELFTKLAFADYFTLITDECTNQSYKEQLGVIIRYKIARDNNVEEKYFGLINLIIALKKP